MSVEAKKFVNNRIINLGLAIAVVGGSLAGCGSYTDKYRSELSRKQQVAEEIARYRFELVLIKPGEKRGYDVTLKLYTNEKPIVDVVNGATRVEAKNVVCPVEDTPQGTIDRMSNTFGCKGSAKDYLLVGTYDVSYSDRGEK